MSAGPPGVVETDVYAEQRERARAIMRPLLAESATPEACVEAQKALRRAGLCWPLRFAGIRWCAERWQILDARRTAQVRAA